MRTLATIVGLLFAVVLVARLTFEATYTDASGARCAAFAVGPEEIDLCHGRFDR